MLRLVPELIFPGEATGFCDSEFVFIVSPLDSNCTFLAGAGTHTHIYTHTHTHTGWGRERENRKVK